MEIPELIGEHLELSFRGPAWHGPSLSEVLDEVDEAVVGSRPLAAAHSIAEIAEHATAWKRIAAERARGAQWREVPPAEDWPEPGAWADVRARLTRAHEDLVSLVAGLDAASLSRDLGDTTLAGTLFGVAQHDLYHAGQIALLRKLPGAGRQGPLACRV